ncbi:unnamed protein product [Linum tenue]|uniref:Lipocalin/cytosolic fatty-acid binding domain-containing protein n=1 Tax=Linum tenue TaxID=586396 RepID=A0AAV0RSJ0_9ROSI|nr:unnamed protein product [Linum tenue]
MSRFVLDSNNLWLLALSDRTMRVNNGPYSPDLNTQDLSGYVGDWKQVARIGSNQHCTHRELEVFGVALISGQKLEELCLNTYNHQLTINREGFMVQWLNPGGGRRVPNARSLYRRLNDVFDWSRSVWWIASSDLICVSRANIVKRQLFNLFLFLFHLFLTRKETNTRHEILRGIFDRLIETNSR